MRDPGGHLIEVGQATRIPAQESPDPGSPFGRGVEVTRDGRAELTLQSPSPLTGYCILNAGNLEEAESLARDMPIIESVRVYEAHSM